MCHHTAELFNRSWFIEPHTNDENNLAGLHGNTHVAKAIGIAHCANLSGDADALKVAKFF